MATRFANLPNPEAGLLALGGILAAGLVGLAIAVDLPVGLALTIGACYAAIVAINLPLAIALWAPLVFLEGVHALNLGSKAAGLLLALVWISSLAVGLPGKAVLDRHRRLLLVLFSLVLWLTLSVIWARDVGQVLADAWHWWAVALVFLIVASSLQTLSVVRLVVVGMVVGAVAAVLIGLADGDLTRTATAAGTAAHATGRLESGAGDPNVLAAGVVPGIVLAVGLWATVRRTAWRWAIGASIVLLCIGLVASESRGGGVAAVVTALTAIVFFRRQRMKALGAVLLTAGILIASLALLPNAWNRISSFDNGGNGRTEIWTVAWRMTEDHPLVGVGLNNYRVNSRDYTLEPGSLQRVRLLVDKPSVVHNMYLQLLSENGIIGLGLFLTFALGCLYASWLAGHRFEARGERVGEALSRAVLVASIGMLAAGTFVSAGVDTRLWILLALGPVLLNLATPTGSPVRAPRLRTL